MLAVVPTLKKRRYLFPSLKSLLSGTILKLIGPYNGDGFCSLWGRIYPVFPFHCICRTKAYVEMRNTMTFRNVIVYGQCLLAPRPEIELEDHPFSAVCEYLLCIFVVTLLSLSTPSGRHIPWWEQTNLTWLGNGSFHKSIKACFRFVSFRLQPSA